MEPVIRLASLFFPGNPDTTGQDRIGEVSNGHLTLKFSCRAIYDAEKLLPLFRVAE
jgi:hypothetical protein